MSWMKCACAGIEFTAEEWAQYCKTHDTLCAAVAEFEGYEYNVHDICVNPTIMACDNKDYMYSFCVTVGNTPDGWTYGIRYNIGTAGFSSDVLWTDRDKYQTDREAAYNGLKIIRDAINREIEVKKGSDIGLETPRANKMLASIERFMDNFDPLQLSLF